MKEVKKVVQLDGNQSNVPDNREEHILEKSFDNDRANDKIQRIAKLVEDEE